MRNSQMHFSTLLEDRSAQRDHMWYTSQITKQNKTKKNANNNKTSTVPALVLRQF